MNECGCGQACHEQSTGEKRVSVCASAGNNKSALGSTGQYGIVQWGGQAQLVGRERADTYL
jgi:hypothetical protein